MNEDERYLFDLQGFLVVEDALDANQLTALNEILDRRIEDEVAADDHTHRFLDLLDWGKPYQDLVDNPRIVDYLAELVGDPLRLDHVYLDIIRSGKGPIGTSLHGGATPLHPTHYYRHRNNTMRNGLFVVAYNLYDVKPGDGGFAAVPGSHKSHYVFPGHWKELDGSQDLPFVAKVTGRAGTAILFTEAMTHGTLPWHGQERRTIFYKYSPPAVSWSNRYFNAADYPAMTERQKAMLAPPSALASPFLNGG
jgi:ectoine hydroxylase-related dioxygenase (phytanoyl-CoA dioxygenase family)